MAEARLSTDSMRLSDVNSDLDQECIVCLEQKLLHQLPCTHKYCHKCLDDIAEGKSRLECPVCQRPADIPVGGFLANSLADLNTNSEKAATVNQATPPPPQPQYGEISLIDFDKEIGPHQQSAYQDVFDLTGVELSTLPQSRRHSATAADVEKAEDAPKYDALTANGESSENCVLSIPPPEIFTGTQFTPVPTQVNTAHIIVDLRRSEKSDSRCHSNECKDTVESHCTSCLQFYCYRCAAMMRDCTSSTKQHSVEPLQDTVAKSLSHLTLCQQSINSQIEKSKQQLTKLHDQKDAMLTAMNAKIKLKQDEIDEKLSLITASQIIEAESDSVQLIYQARSFCSSFSQKSPNKEAVSSTSAPRVNMAATVTKQAAVATRPPVYSPALAPPVYSPAPAPLVPQSLVHIPPNIATGSLSVSVHHHSITGELLLGCPEATKVYNAKENKYVVSQTSSVIREYKGEVFMSYRDNETTAKVVRYNKAACTITQTIFEFPMTKKNAIYISISDRYIAVVDKDSLNCIKLYNRLPRRTQPQRTTLASVFKNIASKDSPFTTKKLPHFAVVYNILFLPDGALLATGHGAGKHRLCKYLIPINPDLNPILAWSNADLHLPFGLAVSKDGLIYVSSARRKTIYILSDQGEKLREMRHDSLPDYYEQISLRGDELAVAGWHSESVIRFKVRVLWKAEKSEREQLSFKFRDNLHKSKIEAAPILQRLNMPAYDIVLILRNAAKHEMKEVLKRAVGNIHSQGGRVGQLENWGTRQLPHRMIKNNEQHTHGFYMLMEADLPANNVEKLRAVLVRDRGVIRPGIVRQEVECQRPCEVGECFFGDLTRTQEVLMKKFLKFKKTPV